MLITALRLMSACLLIVSTGVFADPDNVAHESGVQASIVSNSGNKTIPTSESAANKPAPEHVAKARLTPFSASYRMRTKGSEVAEITNRLSQLDAQHYKYRRETQAIGIFRFIRNTHVVEESFFTLDHGQIRPQRYLYTRSGHKPRQVTVRFDWDKRRASNTLDGKTWDMPIKPGTLDKLSLELALMLSGSSHDEIPEQLIADGGHTKVWRFKRLREVTEQTGAGAFDSVIVKRIRDDNKRNTEYSLAKQLGYLPVRIAHTEKDGSLIDILLTEYHAAPN